MFRWAAGDRLVCYPSLRERCLVCVPSTAPGRRETNGQPPDVTLSIFYREQEERSRQDRRIGPDIHLRLSEVMLLLCIWRERSVSDDRS
jgi:hypothetical protein